MGLNQSTTSGAQYIASIKLEDGVISLLGVGKALKLDADGDTSISATTDDTILIEVSGSDDFQITSNLFQALSGSAIGGASSTFAPLTPIAAQQNLSGAGAITVTEYYTAWTTTAANAGSLADGVMKGQLKKIQLVSDGGDGTLTPNSLSGGTTITFADAGDFALLQWSGSAWVALELGNAADGTSAPVLA